ncbi:hypothetical protein GCM10011332_32480 [Terasakiella brassicae]|jgi:hypothetical protein|uniref:Uncharacterized protein n=1 Tax=Terasakiella brassicae TaxID=1634917 RepID=A0A917C7K2_9PROT|nr:hypothetical protein [Terasakiella brassicae]GGF76025.1 hypothetical protein GCM10011332_32480 [Terasakiella brassicae]
MRLNEFDYQIEEPPGPKSIDLWAGQQNKVYTLFLSVTGVINNLPYRPERAEIWIGNYPIHEVGSKVTIERSGNTDRYAVKCDCIGLYPMVIQPPKDFKTVELDCQALAPELVTERDRHKIPGAKIILGSCNMVDFDNRCSMTLIRSADGEDYANV